MAGTRRTVMGTTIIVAVLTAAVLLFLHIRRNRVAPGEFKTTDELIQWLAAETVDMIEIGSLNS